MNIHHSLACGIAIPLAMIGPPGGAAPTRVPVLLYHSAFVSAPCDYSANNLEALEQDLEQIRAMGFTMGYSWKTPSDFVRILEGAR